jgi:hypothetical protein
MFLTLETKVFQLVFNPQREDVTIENIAPENIEDFQVIFNFQIRPGKNSCQVYQD